QREQAAAVFRRPIVPKINHHSDMSVPTAIRIRLAVAAFGPALSRIEMPMVGMLIDQIIDARIRVDGMWPNVMRSGKIVPKLPIHRVDEEEFAILVPIMPPRIGAAVAKRLEHFPLRMITPDRPA